MPMYILLLSLVGDWEMVCVQRATHAALVRLARSTEEPIG